MAYGDFTLEAIVEQERLTIKDASIFEVVDPVPPSDWLQDLLSSSAIIGLFSGTEKSRSEFIVVPVLIDIERRNHDRFTIFSGKSFDVDRSKGLNGECDFILSKGQPTRLIQAPIFALVEAKKQDIDIGLGQCVAQMIGAQLFNQRKHQPINVIYGCVTTGDRWQFLKLEQQELMIDRIEYSLANNLPDILGFFQLVLTSL